MPNVSADCLGVLACAETDQKERDADVELRASLSGADAGAFDYFQARRDSALTISEEVRLGCMTLALRSRKFD